MQALHLSSITSQEQHKVHSPALVRTLDASYTGERAPENRWHLCTSLLVLASLDVFILSGLVAFCAFCYSKF